MAMGFSKQEFNEENQELEDIEEDEPEVDDEELALVLEDDFADFVDGLDNE